MQNDNDVRIETHRSHLFFTACGLLPDACPRRI
jgi:hypothetical protein